ncbi:MAG: serine/threonine protein kinase [Solirubrobacterales bacterium]|nr:serine/threonine protein kinase [Solirubrobacterales bacterium]
MRASQLPAAGRTSRGASAWLGLRTAATDRLERARSAADGLERGTEATRRAAPDPGPTLVLGRYRLDRRLGAGAFATVWMAHDERLERDVAIKVIPRERVLDRRFEREARAAARLMHPGIVTLYDSAIDDDSAYLVSELVRGGTLAELLETGRLSDRDIVGIAISLCHSLSHAHAQAIVHRDVKPSNVLIPERPTSHDHPAKLTDFGVARVTGGDSLTRTGQIVGTAAYMAPEQAEGLPAGPAADLYALALVTYEALTGINPIWASLSGTGAIHRPRRLGAYLPPLRRQRRDLPRELGCGIDRALRPRPRERGTLDDLCESLSAALPALSDAPGVVASGWPRPSLRSWASADRARSNDGHSDLPAEENRYGRCKQLAQGNPTLPLPWPTRVVGATAAALAAGWLAARLLGPLPLAPAGVALIAWLVVAALPRLGWIAITAILVAGAVGHGRPGGALVLLITALVPLVLMPRRGDLWPLPALAPLLGMVGLAGAWPALAGRARGGAWARAALAATGYVWLVLIASLGGADLYTRRPPGASDSDTWMGSLNAALHHVLAPALSSGMLAVAVVWAIAAGLLPRVSAVRPPAGYVLIVLWCAGLLITPALAPIPLHEAVLGTALAGLLALAPALRTAWFETRDSRNPQAELP